jgi:heterodisulfide reductase subunit C
LRCVACMTCCPVAGDEAFPVRKDINNNHTIDELMLTH